jgi:hypothetical protein
VVGSEGFLESTGESMNFDKNDTAVVFIDPQNDVLSEKASVGHCSTKVLRKTTRLRIWSASSRPQRRMDSRFSSLLTISTPRIKDGSSTVLSNPMRLPLTSSVAKDLDSRWLERIRGRLAGAIQAVHVKAMERGPQ